MTIATVLDPRQPLEGVKRAVHSYTPFSTDVLRRASDSLFRTQVAVARLLEMRVLGSTMVEEDPDDGIALDQFMYEYRAELLDAVHYLAAEISRRKMSHDPDVRVGKKSGPWVEVYI